MKLVIDIDKDVYTRLFDNGIQDNEIAVDDVCAMARALRLGTPLEAQPTDEDCRNCKKWNKCPCGKEGHENGTSIGYSIGECRDYEPNRCDSCTHSEEQDGSNCYECVKGMADNFEAQPKIGYISIDINKLAKEVAEKALDEITYEEKTIREWAEILVNQQPCEDCISREAVIDLTWDWESFINITRRDGLSTLREMRTKIEDLPPVTPQRPKGKWIKCKSRFGTEYFKCSECGRKLNWIDSDDNYCNSCGSDNSESTKELYKEKLAEISGGGEDETSD